MKAQAMAEAKPRKPHPLVGTYYKTSMENAKIAMGKQPAVVTRAARPSSSRPHRPLVEMGYIKKNPPATRSTGRCLEQVIAENKDLYASLKYKSCVSDPVTDIAHPQDAIADGLAETLSAATALRDAGDFRAPSARRRALASIGLFAGIWEILWFWGLADAKLLPPPHIFLGNFPSRPSSSIRRSAGRSASGRNTGPSAEMALLITVLRRRARVGRPADRFGPVDQHRVRCAISRSSRSSRCRPSRCFTGIADRLAAGRDLRLRHRRRAGASSWSWSRCSSTWCWRPSARSTGSTAT